MIVPVTVPNNSPVPKQGPQWYRCKTLWPKKSCVSGNHIPMFSTAYHLKNEVYSVQSGSYTTLATEEWMTEAEYLFEKIKGNV